MTIMADEGQPGPSGTSSAQTYKALLVSLAA
jgi:hypothetical protein